VIRHNGVRLGREGESPFYLYCLERVLEPQLMGFPPARALLDNCEQQSYYALCTFDTRVMDDSEKIFLEVDKFEGRRIDHMQD